MIVVSSLKSITAEDDFGKVKRMSQQTNERQGKQPQANINNRLPAVLRFAFQLFCAETPISFKCLAAEISSILIAASSPKSITVGADFGKVERVNQRTNERRGKQPRGSDGQITLDSGPRRRWM